MDGNSDIQANAVPLAGSVAAVAVYAQSLMPAACAACHPGGESSTTTQAAGEKLSLEAA